MNQWSVAVKHDIKKALYKEDVTYLFKLVVEIIERSVLQWRQIVIILLKPENI